MLQINRTVEHQRYLSVIIQTDLIKMEVGVTCSSIIYCGRNQYGVACSYHIIRVS